MSFFGNKRKWLLLLSDFFVYTAVFFATLILEAYPSWKFRLDFWECFFNFCIFAVFIFVVRFAFRNYSNVWRYANSFVFLKMVFADAIGGIIAFLVSYFVPGMFLGMWLSVSMVCMCNGATIVSRLLYQEWHKRLKTSNGEQEKIRVAIVGAGRTGVLLAEELIYNKVSKYKPVCFIDTSNEKIGNIILGLRVYADNDSVLVKLRELSIQEVVIALPTLSSEKAKAMHDFYAKSGCKIKVYALPVNEIGAETGGKRVLRELRIEDLLFRDGLNVTNGETVKFYKDKVVLVTGGGGSIGSELCRQIAKCSPRKLIIFDIYENNAYDIQQELLRAYGNKLDLAVEIGSVRERARLEAVFSNYRPQIVFHAAAHKHVPLMEHSNAEAIKNNVLGTYNTADMAEKYGADKFILISTDKAVNPTNVMGASKRLCEMVVQCRVDSDTTFAAVRFGNVLGSNGSVIPLFKRQIEAGGPVTVTDKRIIRYFMTIPEASGLVMQAGAMAKRNELFVLDMGNPVKIVDLAENMIKLFGLVPYRDINIEEIGLRPGEKLYEELLIKTETLDKTENNMIFVERDTSFTREEIEEKLEILRAAVKGAESEIGAESVKLAMMKTVPSFRPPEEVNSRAEESKEMKLLQTC